jgi:peptidoglycan/xylan/chitin deacetylase (PgdA/CDA1 family)
MGNSPIRLAIRFDDPSPASKTHVEEAVLAELSQRDVKATFAVVPFWGEPGVEAGLTEKAAAHLIEARSKGYAEIALHGYSHRNAEDRSHESSRRFPSCSSEFDGVPYDDQLELIRRGKAHLESVFGSKITGFVPPWNTYDASTLRAVAENDLEYLSAGYQQFRGMLTGKRLKCPVLIPRTAKLHQLELAIEEARQLRPFDPVVVVCIHHFDFELDENTLPGGVVHSYEELGKKLDWIKKQADVVVVCLDELSRQENNQEMCWPTQRRWRDALHWRMQRFFPNHCFTTRAFGSRPKHAIDYLRKRSKSLV